MVWFSNIQIITALMEIIGKFAISQMLFHLHNDFSAFLISYFVKENEKIQRYHRSILQWNYTNVFSPFYRWHQL